MLRSCDRRKWLSAMNDVQLDDVLYVPQINSSLLSVSRLVRDGYTVTFDNNVASIYKNKILFGEAYSKNNLFILNSNNINTHQAKLTRANLDLWHRRLGHRDKNILKQQNLNNAVNGIEITSWNYDKCEVCMRGKASKNAFPQSSTIRSEAILDLVHSDICGPMRRVTPSGNRYILTFIDDYSRFTYVYLLKNKYQVTQKYKEFAQRMLTIFNKQVKVLRSDNGGEYMSKELNNYLRNNGTKHELSAPYCPQQNGVAERKNRSLVEMANCMLIDAAMDEKYWGEAILTSNYLQNRLVTRAHGKTPYEMWYKRKPNLNYIRVFGCDAYAHIPSFKRGKFDERATKLKLVGYSEQSKAYRLLDEKTNKVFISRDVQFVEEKKDVRSSNTGNRDVNGKSEVVITISSNRKLDEDDEQEEINSEIEIREQKSNDEERGETERIDINEFRNEIEKDETENVEKDETENVEKDETENVEKDETENIIVRNNEKLKRFEEENEPKSYKEMLRSCDRRKWLSAMNDEMESIEKLKVWDLVERPRGKHVIPSKWVYKVKGDPHSSMRRYKARIVARGYSQKYGEDYDEVFAPVVKHQTIRLLLTICGLKNYAVRHLDVRTAFLNGELKEDVYMEQPEGFKCQGKENWVCKLRKSIYGLKQAARSWNQKIDSTLLKLGFRKGIRDPCLYSKEISGKLMYVLVYVDDLILAFEKEENILEIEKLINKEFETKSMGNLCYYLGIEIEREKNGIFKIHQKSYIKKLLEKFSMNEAKSSKIPLDPGYYKYAKECSKLIENKEIFRMAIGSLLYLATNTRPDITASVVILGRKVSNPTETDWTEMKRILKYLKGTQNIKMKLGDPDADNQLVCYADADWASDTEDRKSTSGSVIFYKGSPISWLSRKQSSVSLSSTEAEYISLTEACKDLLWTMGILDELDERPDDVLMYEDNQSVLKMLESEGTKSSKHIDVRHHFIRDIKREGKIKFQYCSTQDMIADILTKPLNATKFLEQRSNLGLSDKMY